MEHLDVLVIGAGLSGIGAGHHLQTACPWADYAIFEARGAIGGTWDLFRYPGIRSDSDMFTLGYSFRPWDGEKSIADGGDILQYIVDTAAEAGIDEKIRFHHRIVRAEWTTADARWLVTAEKSDPENPDAAPEIVEVTANFIFSCSGYYRYDRGHMPDFPGQEQFQGQWIHPQFWPEDLDYAGKKVVVIGSGATAITLVPSMSHDAAHVTMLQRSPTYITALPAKDPIANLLRRVLPERLSGTAIRWMKAMMTQGSYRLSRRHPNVMKKILRFFTKASLPKGYDIDTHFTPNYNPWDQRLCVAPNGDLFKAIKKGTVSVVTDHIDTITETGVRVKSGQELNADVIVSATGLEVLFIGGIDVVVDDEKVDVTERLNYKGMMLEGLPNFAMAFGYTNASWTLKCDLTCGYVTRMLNHMHATGMRQVTPVNSEGVESADSFLDLTSGYVQRAADKMPKQGKTMPWQVHQSYLHDYRAMKRSNVRDDNLEFTNPAPAKGRVPVEAGANR